MTFLVMKEHQFFSTNISVESFSNELVEIELKNMTDYSFRLSTYLDEPLNLSWIILEPNGDQLSIFDLRQIVANTDYEPVHRFIEGRFNSTTSGKYNVLLTDLAGHTFSGNFAISELTHQWMDKYKHFFNPAPMIAGPFLLAGSIILFILILAKIANTTN